MSALLPLIFAILGNKELMAALGPLLGALKGTPTAPVVEQAEVLFDLPWLQRSLTKLGHQVEETGKYDGQTKAAVEEFQRKHSLVPDGWAGTKTCAVLFAQLAKEA